MNKHPSRTSLRLMKIVLALLAGLAAAGSAATGLSQDERSACLQRPEAQQASCLRETAAARDAARSGQLSGSADYEANRIRRCDALPAAERDACVRRARGEGAVSGSVEGGGIMREYREIILPPAAPQPAPASLQPEAPAASAASPVPAPHPAPAGVMLESAQPR